MPTRSLQSSGFPLLVFALGLAGIWILDVFVNLGLVARLLERDDFLATPRLCTGLFMADLLLALLLAIVSLMFGAVLAGLPGGGGRRAETLAVLTAGLCALATLGPLYFTNALSGGLPRTVMVAAAVSVIVWFVMRRSPGDRRRSESSIPYLVMTTGFATVALISLGSSVAVSLRSLLPVALVAVGWSCTVRARSAFMRMGLGLLLPTMAVVTVVWACLAAQTYGRLPAEDVVSRPAGGPTIVLIVMDTVRADHLKRHGYPRDTMPALERWAESAVVAGKAVSPAGWTSPAHASLFTGRTVSDHGVHYVRRHTFGSTLATPAYEDVEWLPARLAEQGYRTLAVSSNWNALFGTDMGFERVLTPSHALAERTLGWLVERACPFAAVARLSEAFRWRLPYADADEIVDITLRALPDGDAPLFLFVNFLDAHSPYAPPQSALDALGVRAERVFSRYTDHRTLNLMWDALPEEKYDSLIDLYDGELRWLDHHLARLLQAVEARYGDEAVVIVTSDHGEELGEAGRVGHEYGLSERILHVPLMVRAPGLEPTTLDGVTDLRSLHEFMLRWGFGGSAGVDLLRAVGDHGIVSERYPSGRDIGTFGDAYDRAWVSLYENGLKGVGPSEYGFELETYDDPTFEATRRAETESMKVRIDTYWRTRRDDRVDGGEELDAARIRRLRSLGY